MPTIQYHVYVVELSIRKLTEHARFRAANPQFNVLLECQYIGISGKDPEERFKQHKTGYRSKRGYNISSRLLWTYGRYLRPYWSDAVNKFWKNMRQQSCIVHLRRIKAMDDQTRKMGEQAINAGNERLMTMDLDVRNRETQQSSQDRL